VSTAKGEHIPTSSPELTALLNKREKTANALARCQKSIASLEQYLSSLTVEHLDVSKLESVMDNYDSTGEKLDAKKSDLTEELRKIDADISFERARIAVPHENNKLRVKAAIGVFAQAEGDVEIALIYGSPSLPPDSFLRQRR
jgi:chromosome segregation ATPase